MKARGLQKSKFPNSLINWEKFGSTAKANIQITKFPISLMNWEKLRSSAKMIFKNPNF